MARRSRHGWLEELELRRLLSGLVVQDTAGADTITLGVNDNGGIRVTLNGVQTDYAADQWDSVVIESDRGADAINVLASVVPATVHFPGKLRNETVRIKVGDSGSVQNIKAPLSLYGALEGGGTQAYASVLLDDSSDTGARSVEMNVQGNQEQVDGLAPARISIGLVDPPVDLGESLSVNFGSGADTLHLNALRENLPTFLSNSGGSDSFTVGDGYLGHVQSYVQFNAPDVGSELHGSTVLFDDSSDPASAAFSFFSFQSPAPIYFGPVYALDVEQTGMPRRTYTIDGNEFAEIILDGGSGGNQVSFGTFFHLGPSNQVQVNAGSGNDAIEVDGLAQDTQVSINGQSGDDSFRIGVLDALDGDLQLDGGGGNDHLTVIGPLDSGRPGVPVDVSADLIEYRIGKIEYTRMPNLRLENGNYQINGDLGSLSLAIVTENIDTHGGTFESSTRATINASQNLAGLDIEAPVLVKGGAGIVVGTTSLQISGGSLDLADGTLQVQYGAQVSPFAAIKAAVLAHSLFTSSADGRHGLGYVDSADGVNASLPKQTVVVTFALKGDANLDRSVDFADLVGVAQHYGLAAGANWDEGDFDLDGAVGFSDLVLVAQNYGQKQGGAAAGLAARPAIRPASAAALMPEAKSRRRIGR